MPQTKSGFKNWQRITALVLVIVFSAEQISYAGRFDDAYSSIKSTLKSNINSAKTSYNSGIQSIHSNYTAVSNVYNAVRSATGISARDIISYPKSVIATKLGISTIKAIPSTQQIKSGISDAAHKIYNLGASASNLYFSEKSYPSVLNHPLDALNQKITSIYPEFNTPMGPTETFLIANPGGVVGGMLKSTLGYIGLKALPAAKYVWPKVSQYIPNIPTGLKNFASNPTARFEIGRVGEIAQKAYTPIARGLTRKITAVRNSDSARRFLVSSAKRIAGYELGVYALNQSGLEDMLIPTAYRPAWNTTRDYVLPFFIMPGQGGIVKGTTKAFFTPGGVKTFAQTGGQYLSNLKNKATFTTLKSVAETFPAKLTRDSIKSGIVNAGKTWAKEARVSYAKLAYEGKNYVLPVSILRQGVHVAQDLAVFSAGTAVGSGALNKAGVKRVNIPLTNIGVDTLEFKDLPSAVNTVAEYSAGGAFSGLVFGSAMSIAGPVIGPVISRTPVLGRFMRWYDDTYGNKLFETAGLEKRLAGNSFWSKQGISFINKFNRAQNFLAEEFWVFREPLAGAVFSRLPMPAGAQEYLEESITDYGKRGPSSITFGLDTLHSIQAEGGVGNIVSEELRGIADTLLPRGAAAAPVTAMPGTPVPELSTIQPSPVVSAKTSITIPTATFNTVSSAGAIKNTPSFALSRPSIQGGGVTRDYLGKQVASAKAGNLDAQKFLKAYSEDHRQAGSNLPQRQIAALVSPFKPALETLAPAAQAQSGGAAIAYGIASSSVTASNLAVMSASTQPANVITTSQISFAGAPSVTANQGAYNYLSKFVQGPFLEMSRPDYDSLVKNPVSPIETYQAISSITIPYQEQILGELEDAKGNKKRVVKYYHAASLEKALFVERTGLYNPALSLINPANTADERPIDTRKIYSYVSQESKDNFLNDYTDPARPFLIEITVPADSQFSRIQGKSSDALYFSGIASARVLGLNELPVSIIEQRIKKGGPGSSYYASQSSAKGYVQVSDASVLNILMMPENKGRVFSPYGSNAVGYYIPEDINIKPNNHALGYRQDGSLDIFNIKTGAVIHRAEPVFFENSNLKPADVITMPQISSAEVPSSVRSYIGQMSPVQFRNNFAMDTRINGKELDALANNPESRVDRLIELGFNQHELQYRLGGQPVLFEKNNFVSLAKPAEPPKVDSGKLAPNTEAIKPVILDEPVLGPVIVPINGKDLTIPQRVIATLFRDKAKITQFNTLPKMEIEQKFEGKDGQVFVLRSEQDPKIKFVTKIVARYENDWFNFNIPVKDEFDITNRLKSNNVRVPAIYDFDEKNNILFMEFIEGQKLGDFLNQPHLQEALNELAGKIGAEIWKMHEAGVVHRDLHDQNIMVNDKEPTFIDLSRSAFFDKMNFELRFRELDRAIDGMKGQRYNKEFPINTILDTYANLYIEKYGVDEFIKGLNKKIYEIDSPYKFPMGVSMMRTALYLKLQAAKRILEDIPEIQGNPAEIGVLNSNFLKAEKLLKTASDTMRESESSIPKFGFYSQAELSRFEYKMFDNIMSSISLGPQTKKLIENRLGLSSTDNTRKTGLSGVIQTIQKLLEPKTELEKLLADAFKVKDRNLPSETVTRNVLQSATHDAASIPPAKLDSLKSITSQIGKVEQGKVDNQPPQIGAVEKQLPSFTGKSFPAGSEEHINYREKRAKEGQARVNVILVKDGNSMKEAKVPLTALPKEVQEYIKKNKIKADENEIYSLQPEDYKKITTKEFKPEEVSFGMGFVPLSGTGAGIGRVLNSVKSWLGTRLNIGINTAFSQFVQNVKEVWLEKTRPKGSLEEPLREIRYVVTRIKPYLLSEEVDKIVNEVSSNIRPLDMFNLSYLSFKSYIKVLSLVWLFVSLHSPANNFEPSSILLPVFGTALLSLFMSFKVIYVDGIKAMVDNNKIIFPNKIFLPHNPDVFMSIHEFVHYSGFEKYDGWASVIEKMRKNELGVGFWKGVSREEAVRAKESAEEFKRKHGDEVYMPGGNLMALSNSIAKAEKQIRKKGYIIKIFKMVDEYEAEQKLGEAISQFAYQLGNSEAGWNYVSLRVHGVSPEKAEQIVRELHQPGVTSQERNQRISTLLKPQIKQQSLLRKLLTEVSKNIGALEVSAPNSRGMENKQKSQPGKSAAAESIPKSTPIISPSLKVDGKDDSKLKLPDGDVGIGGIESRMTIIGAEAALKEKDLGFCLTPDSLIELADGAKRPLIEIKAGDLVVSLNQDTGKLEPHRVNVLLDMGVKPVYKLTTQSGKSLKTTLSHPYLTKTGWKKLKNIKVGDEITVTGDFSKDFIPLAFDSYRRVPFFTNAYFRFGNYGESAAKNFSGVSIKERKNQRSRILDGRVFDSYQDNSRIRADWEMEDISKVVIKGDKDKVFLNTEVDDFFIAKPGKIPLDDRIYFIAGGPESFYRSDEKTFIGKEFHLNSFLEKDVLVFNNPDSIMNSRLDIFAGKLGIAISEDSFSSIACLDKLQNHINRDSGSFDAGFTETDFRVDRNSIFQRIVSHYSHLRTKLYHKLMDVSNLFKPAAAYAQSAPKNNIFWDKIVSIDYLGSQQVYDIEVEGTHNFVAEGIVAHNTYVSSGPAISPAKLDSSNEIYAALGKVIEPGQPRPLDKFLAFIIERHSLHDSQDKLLPVLEIHKALASNPLYQKLTEEEKAQFLRVLDDLHILPLGGLQADIAEEWRPMDTTVNFVREILNSGIDNNNEYYFELLKDNHKFAKETEKIFAGRQLLAPRLDTYIYNQAANIEQAIVEIIANAQDAMVKGKAIGRFGVGAWQMFQELRNLEDSIIITTSTDGIIAVKITFRRLEKKLFYKTEVITKDVKKGTKVEVKTKLSPQEVDNRLNYIKYKFETNLRSKVVVNGEIINKPENYNYINGDVLEMPDISPVEVEINTNGYTVTDKGSGMGPKILYEKYFIPKGTSKALEGKPLESGSQIKEETKIFYSRSLTNTNEGKVAVQISGQVINEIPIFGINIPEKMIIELPYSAWLPESRDRIALDTVTTEGLINVVKKLIDLNRQDIKNRYALLNALAQFVNYQLKDSENKKLAYEIRALCRDLIQQEQNAGKIILPNRQEFRSLAVPQDKEVIYLDESLYDFQPAKIPGSERIRNFSSSQYSLYSADLDISENKDVYIDGLYPNGKGWIILDRTTYEKHKNSPWLINLLFNFNISYGDEGRKLGEITAPKSEVHNLAVKPSSGKESKVLTKESQMKEKIEKAVLDKEEADRLAAIIINDNKIKDAFNKFSEDDKDFLLAKIKETVDAKLINGENIARAKENLETWLSSLLELKSMFSESVFPEGWVAKQFNHYLKIFTKAKGYSISHKVFNGELYFWVNDAEHFYNIYKLGANAEIQQIAQDAEVLFFENKAYIVIFNQDTKLNKISILKADGSTSLILDNVIILNRPAADKEKEWIVFTGEGNKIKVKIISPAGVRELYSIDEVLIEEVRIEKEAKTENKLTLLTSSAVKRGEDIFLYTSVFGGSAKLYRIDKDGKVIPYLLDIKTSSFSELNIKEILSLSDGSVAVLGTESDFSIFSHFGSAIKGSANSFLLFFDKDGNRKFSTDTAKGFVGTNAWTDGEHVYFQAQDSLQRLDRDGKVENIFIGMNTDKATHCPTCGKLVPTTHPYCPYDGAKLNLKPIEIKDIKFFGDYMYILRPQPEKLTDKVLYWRKVNLKNLEQDNLITSFDGFFKMGGNLWYVGEMGGIYKVDNEGKGEFISVTYDSIYQTQDSIYTTYLRTSDSARIIEKINKDGDKQVIQEIKNAELLQDNISIEPQKNQFIFSLPYYPDNPGSLSRHIVFNADTEETFELAGGNLGENAGKEEFKGMILGRNVIGVGSKAIGILPTLPLMLEKNAILKANLKLLKEYARMNYIFEQLNDEERSKLFFSLANYTDWMPAYIFMEDAIIKRGLTKELRGIFGGLIDKTESIKQLRQLFTFINFVFEKTENDQTSERIIKRWANIYLRNRELADIIAAKMQEEFDTGKSLSVGKFVVNQKYEALRFYKESVDMALLPSDVRLYLTYLTKEDLASVLGIYEQSKFEGEKEKIEITHRDLAALIRLPDEFPEKISRKDLDWQTILECVAKIEDKNLKGIQRDYTQSVNSQDKTQSFWIRELSQNSRDAIKDSLRVGALNNDNKNRVISIKSGMSKNPNSAGSYEYINSVYDPVGMSAYTILNYLFPPDRSSKENGGSGGFFGHGLYTLFIPCDEVRMRTGKGQETYEFILKPYYDTGKNLLNIEVLRMSKYKSDFKGTEIQRVKYSKSQSDEEPILDDLFLTMQVKRLVGGVSALGKDGVTILLNGEAINENMPVFETISHSDLAAPILSKFSPTKTERVTVDELLVDNIDYKYTQFIPKTVLDALLARGWNIDFPQGTPLPRTRNGITAPQKYAPQLAVLALKSYIKLYMEDPNFEIYGLDKDYIYSQEHPLSIPMEILHDATNINNGHPETVNFFLYKDNPHALVKLLTVINIDYKGKMKSLADIKTDVLKEYQKKDVEDVSLEGKLPEGMKNLQGRAEAFIRGDIGAKSADITEEILQEPIIKGFRVGCTMLNALTEKSNKYYGFNLVFDANFVATGGSNRITWNLAYYPHNLGAFLGFLEDKSSGLAGLTETFIHESSHSEQDIIRMQNKYIGTHQAEQDMHGALGWIMKQLLTRMVKRTDNMQAFQESLLKDTGYTLEELQKSYKRVAESIENKRKTLFP